ncbi:hypothetical protein [Leisingera sp. ANG59]|uniref:hypothetical protein n=1 Tax=Leisingera sp. ANG59 TaxID=2675221 RepID=UPI0015733431|nr:hypothetical protein [Leisingera sp. ANG59]NSY39298.1 hypothetical protein [Leisingera sp. ANG59]
MAKLKVDLGLDDTQDAKPDAEAEILRQLSAPLPSPSKARAGSLKTAPRVQFAFSNVPKPIKQAFIDAAEAKGMGMKEFLYHCLRAGGVDIPPMEEIDGRRR